MFKKKLLLIFFSISLILCLFAPDVFAARTRWKIATLAPKNLGWAILYQQLVTPWVLESTDSEVVMKLYWGGLMGNDDDYLKKMRIGQLQGAGLSGWGTMLAAPEFSVLGLPFLFNGYEEVDYIREIMFNSFDYYFEQNGYKLIMWLDQDFDQIYSTKYKFDTLEDFKKSKILTWSGPIEAAMLKALGASPLPMDVTDVPAAKRAGILDTNIAPSIWQVGAQLYTIDKYVNLMRTTYAPATIIITIEQWEKLPDAYKEKLWEKQKEVQRLYCLGVRADNEKCLEGMIDYGVKPIIPNPENLAKIRNAAMSVYGDMSGELYPPDLLQEVLQHLAAFRKGADTEKTAITMAEIKTIVKETKKVKAVVEVEELDEVEVAEVAPEPVKIAKPEIKPVIPAAPAKVAKIEKEAAKVEKAEKEYAKLKKADSKALLARVGA